MISLFSCACGETWEWESVSPDSGTCQFVFRCHCIGLIYRWPDGTYFSVAVRNTSRDINCLFNVTKPTGVFLELRPSHLSRVGLTNPF